MLSVVDNGPAPACPPRFNLAAHVLGAAERVPDKIALSVVGPARAERWSYARLLSDVTCTAAWLVDKDLPPKARILMRIGNSAAFPVVFLGAVAAGYVPVPTPATLTSREVSQIADLLHPHLIVADRVTSLPDASTPVAFVDDRPEIIEGARPAFADTGANDPAYIVFTSGSSEGPRGVVHAHRAIWARKMMWEDWYGLSEADRVMHAGALNWTYTLGTGLLDPWAVGATALVPADGNSIESLPLMMARHDVSIFAAVPGVYRRMLRRESLPRLPRLRHALSAGEKLPQIIREAWQKRTGTDIHEAFGQSECSTFLSGNPSRTAPANTLGFPQSGRHVAILGDDGTPVPIGNVGMLSIDRTDPGLMLGYLDDTTALTGPWFPTGDLARLRDDGAIEYHGRADDVMTAGGYRVSPSEVEAAFQDIDGVQEVAATDVALDKETTVIALFYVADRDADEAMLARHAEERLATFKCPRVFVRVAELPRGANGKLLRRQLKSEFKASV